MLPSPPQTLFILLGPPRNRWPEPLATALELGDVLLEPVSSLHAAAAHIAESSSMVRGILLDPSILTASDLHLLRTIKRRIPITLIMLPLTSSSSPAAHNAAELGVLPWHEATPFFAAHPPSNHQRTPAPDNNEPLPPETPAENTVTSAVEPRYDDFGVQPLLTEDEIRALLGTPE